MLKKINELKAILNQELEKKELNSKEILLLSKKIDELMVQYYRDELKHR